MKTILFADDSRNIREYCRVALEEDGYRVVLACDGLEATRLFCEETPEIVILDICMPRMNGLEALERLKGIAPQIPVILFTAYDDDCVQDHRGILADACVEKSDDLTELKRTVGNVLGTAMSDGRSRSWRCGLPPVACGAPALETSTTVCRRLK